MSYVAAMLLMYMDEEVSTLYDVHDIIGSFTQDVFWALVTLFEGPKYLANFYDKNFAKYVCVYAYNTMGRSTTLVCIKQSMTAPWYN